MSLRIAEGHVAGQRKYLLPIVIGMFLAGTAPSWPAAPDIILPEPFALELPEGTATLGANDEAMRSLAARVKADGHPVTVALPRERIGPGAWRTIWSAWDGARRDRPLARRESVLIVLPHGTTPVGRTGYTSATRIVRDASGFLHMVWTDAWRAGATEGVMYRRARIMPDGSAALETDVQDLAPHRGNWTALPALAVSGDTVHFTWQDNGTTRYRFLTHIGIEWRWSEDIDTKAPAPRRYAGPSIAADPNGVHILTADGHYIASRDGGRNWISEMVPFGTYRELGMASLTLDSGGRPLAAADVLISEAEKGLYRTLRIVRRTGPGQWQAVPSPVDGRMEWAQPGVPAEAVVSDGFRLLEDRTGAMHALWHGTAVSRVEGAPRAYYAWRPPNGAWGAPVSLREPDPAPGFAWSSAGGMTLDGETAMPLVMQEMHKGWRYRGMDLELNLFRDGVRRAEPFPMTRFVVNAMRAGEPFEGFSVVSPDAAPGLSRASNGRIWADLLMALQPIRASAPGVIVWQRRDVTDWVNGPR